MQLLNVQQHNTGSCDYFDTIAPLSAGRHKPPPPTVSCRQRAHRRKKNVALLNLAVCFCFLLLCYGHGRELTGLIRCDIEAGIRLDTSSLSIRFERIASNSYL
jgi:hypothetical protein